MTIECDVVLFMSAIKTRRKLLEVFATTLLFLLLPTILIPRSFVFDSTVEKNTSKSVLRDPGFSTNQIIEIHSAHPLFFKDGLQNICLNSEHRRHFRKQVRRFSRPNNHIFKCLTVSENGTSTTFTSLSLSALYTIIENGDAILFGAGIDKKFRNDTWFYGRLMNRLIQLRNAISHAASCGKLVVLPRTLSTVDPESWGEFDCADFRLMGYPISNGNVVGTTAGSDRMLLVSSQANNKTQTIKDSCSMLFPQDAANWFFYSPPDLHSKQDVKNRSIAAHRIFLAWWGLGPGYFRCNICSERDLNSTIAWLRSGDVFLKRNPPYHYGQPPLEYYIQSIKHSKASNVLVLWEDSYWKRGTNSNPLVSALSNFDSGNQSDSGSAITVTLLSREPFYKVLHRLFCARNAIIGVSSLSLILTLSPNVQTIFLGKPSIFSQAREYGTADIYFYDVGVSHSLDLKSNNDTSSNNIGLRYYSVYKEWTNSVEQRQEMLSFQGGALKTLLLQNSTKRNMT